MLYRFCSFIFSEMNGFKEKLESRHFSVEMRRTFSFVLMDRRQPLALPDERL